MPCSCEDDQAAPCAWCGSETKPTGRRFATAGGVVIGRLCSECSADAAEMLAEVRDEQEGVSR